MRIPRLDQWEPVLVVWMDSVAGPDEWRKLNARDREIHGVITVGQVESQGDDRLTLVFTRDDGGGTKQVRGFITIPTVAITELKRLA